MKIILNEFGCYFVLRFIVHFVYVVLNPLNKIVERVLSIHFLSIKYNKKVNALSLPYCYFVKSLVYYQFSKLDFRIYWPENFKIRIFI
jgi:hypothetical protein